VSILCDEQGELSQYFSSKERPLFIHEFDEVEHAEAVTGAPILTGCLAYFDCRVTMKHEGGDHTIFVGRVETFGAAEALVLPATDSVAAARIAASFAVRGRS